MKLLSFLRKVTSLAQKKSRKSFGDYQQELLVKHGREQFKRLLDKGLGVPVVLL